jgi:hypothetical protein
MEKIVKYSNTLGVKTNKGKFFSFAGEKKFIGFIWNGKLKTVCLPEGKLYNRVTRLKAFLKQGLCSYEDIEILVGQLNHVLYILLQLQCYLCSLYRWMKGWKVFTAMREMPADVKEDLDEWLYTLLNFKPTRLMPNPAPTRIGWVGDASTSFGIGVLIGHWWAQFQLRQIVPIQDQEQEDAKIAVLEAITIRLSLVMLETLGIKQHKTFIVWTDNTTTLSRNGNLKIKRSTTSARRSRQH